ncbi:MAG: hypothetical protein ACR2K2_12545 [Mycobacteriales bacterium]
MSMVDVAVSVGVGVWVGIPVPVAVCLLYAATVALGWLALLLARLDIASGLLLVGFVLTVAVFLLFLLAAVPVYDNSRQRRSMLQVVRQHEPDRKDSLPRLQSHRGGDLAAERRGDLCRLASEPVVHAVEAARQVGLDKREPIVDPV